MKVPQPAKITGRSSSITNAFIQAIIPTKPWSSNEEAEALLILGMKRPDIHCAYCGGETSEWDHLFPIVRNKKPTGFIHEIRNLVPACGRCNHSKSGADWNVWFRSLTSNSPTRRGIANCEQRFKRLEAFVTWGELKPLQFETPDNKDQLEEYWGALTKLLSDMVEAQRLAEQVRPLIQQQLDSNMLY